MLVAVPLRTAQYCQIFKMQMKSRLCFVTSTETVPFLAEVVEPERQSTKIEFESQAKDNAALNFDDLVSVESSLAAAQNR